MPPSTGRGAGTIIHRPIGNINGDVTPAAVSFITPVLRPPMAFKSPPGLTYMARDLPQYPPHDLARPRLGQTRGPVDDVRRRDGADGLADGPDEVFPQSGILGGMLVGVLEGDKGIDRLTLRAEGWRGCRGCSMQQRV